MKSIFPNKGTYNANIKLTEKDEIVQNDKNVVETLNGFLENAAFRLKLNENSLVIKDEHKNIQNPIKKLF